MKSLYLFTGLGADESVLSELDFTGYEPVFVQWVPPLDNEPIESYALRLTEQIPEKHPVLIGLSFGGLMAIEVAKHVEPEKVILIASVKNRTEIPAYYRFASRIGLHRLVSPGLIRRSGFVVNWLFGARGEQEKILLRNILRRTDVGFLKWALDAIAKWHNDQLPENLIHIHGTKDRLLPFRTTTSVIPIENGGHFMTLNRAAEISGIIHRILQQL
jgi:hypothetical protein